MPKLSPVSYKQLVKVFEADGFRWVRTEGDHMAFTKPGVLKPVVIPKYAAAEARIIGIEGLISASGHSSKTPLARMVR